MCFSARLLKPALLYCWLRLLGLRANYCLCAMNLLEDSMYCLMLRSRNVRIFGLRMIIILIAFLSKCLISMATHLGNLINDIYVDKDDILKKHHTMCVQINNDLCFLVRWMLLLRHSC